MLYSTIPFVFYVPKVIASYFHEEAWTREVFGVLTGYTTSGLHRVCQVQGFFFVYEAVSGVRGLGSHGWDIWGFGVFGASGFGICMMVRGPSKFFLGAVWVSGWDVPPLIHAVLKPPPPPLILAVLKRDSSTAYSNPYMGDC